MKILGKTTDGETIFAVPPMALEDLLRGLKSIAEFFGGMGAARKPEAEKLSADYADGRRLGDGDARPPAEGGGDGGVRGRVGVGAAERLTAGSPSRGGRTEPDEDDSERWKKCLICGERFYDHGKTNQRRVCDDPGCRGELRRRSKREWARKQAKLRNAKRGEGAPVPGGADFAARRIEMIRRATEKANAKAGKI